MGSVALSLSERLRLDKVYPEPAEGLDATEILELLKRFSHQICQIFGQGRQIRGEIPAEDAAAMGLPERDFLPITVEEKIIAHADNLVWNGILTEAESLAAHERKLGAGSPALARIVALAHEIHSLSGGST